MSTTASELAPTATSWRTPLVTTAYAHIEQFAVAPLGDLARLQKRTQCVVVLSGAAVPGGESLIRLGQLQAGSGAG